MKIFGVIVLMLAVIIGAFALEGWLCMLLVNWVCGLFGVAFTLTFFQGVGICVLLTFIGGFFKTSSSKK